MLSMRLVSLVLALGSLQAYGFSFNNNNILAAYWGQDAYGNTGTNPAYLQQPIDFYCNLGTMDTFQIAFVESYISTGGLPTINLANSCGGPYFAGTSLLNCQSLESSIQACQAAGKMVTISLGGDTSYNAFTSAAQAQQFGDTIWNLFLGGSSSTRPFGNAVLDGVDFDIEAGSTTYYDSLINQLRSHFNGASKPYYITGAPQCPFPDLYLGSVINEVAFDAVYVQFYNNPCGTDYYPSAFDFSTWDNWAKTQSANKNVKVFIGVAAAPAAAGHGYVDSSELATIIDNTRSQYSSFGGVMMWDASWAYANNRYDSAVKSALGSSTSSGSPPPPPPPPPSGSGNRIHPNGDTSKCLDVVGAVFANGTPVDIYDCNGTAAQNWIINDDQTSVQVAGQNYCLDAGSSPENGTQMKIWECYSGLAAQTWYYTGDQRISLMNQGFCLDLTNDDLNDGEVMQIWSCTTGDTNQIWTLS